MTTTLKHNRDNSESNLIKTSNTKNRKDQVKTTEQGLRNEERTIGNPRDGCFLEAPDRK